MHFNQNFKAQREIVSQLMALEDYKHYTQEQRDKILQKRISRFYDSNDHIDVSEQHYKPKLEPPNAVGDFTVNDTLILFGVDFMNSSAIKQRFKVNDPQFSHEKLDGSNCVLRYSSAEYARQAILQNFEKASATAFKIQQGLQDSVPAVNISQQQNILEAAQKNVPKQWIQLQPYIYRHYYRDQRLCPHLYKDYTRKLYLRYATYHQKSAGKVSLQTIEQLYRKCEQVWKVEAERNNQLKKLLYVKLKEFKQRKDVLQRKLKQSQIIDGIIQNSNVHHAERSRSRQAHFRRDHSQHNQQPNRTSAHQQQNRRRHHQKAYKQSNKMAPQGQFEAYEKQERQRPAEQKQHSQIAELNQLINGIKGVTLRLEINSNQDEEEYLHKNEQSELCQQLNKLNFSKLKAEYIPIPYKLAKPTQIRLNNCRKSRFKYHEYIKMNEEIQSKVMKYSEVDLTLE